MIDKVVTDCRLDVDDGGAPRHPGGRCRRTRRGLRSRVQRPLVPGVHPDPVADRHPPGRHHPRRWGKGNKALHAKIDCLIAAIDTADNRLIAVEQRTAEELEAVRVHIEA